ncbi:hypothetical protein MNBD_ACTINO02-2675 [hydrothermal vent metagenome]|uniref:Uncharacterized protein n=1 Tax=hydrothermal vent metagenome TaxID=652676 RepID=A0A3B0SAZ6_9ZZZZ
MRALEVATVKKRLFEALPIIGSLFVIQSIFWEFARMKPAYGFLVEPWAMRGTESNHAVIFVAIGALLLVSSVAVMWKGSEDSKWGPMISVGIVVLAVVIAAAVGDPSRTKGLGGIGAALIAILIGRAITRLVARYTGFMNEDQSERSTVDVWKHRVVVIASIGGVYFALVAADLQLSAAAMTAVIGGAIVIASVVKDPIELAANRTLILGSLGAFSVLAFSAGALRSNLLSEQVELTTLAAQYKDTQVTSGWLFAVAGSALVLLGAISMWAKRRDVIVNGRRIRKQREAAEKSKRELEAAMNRG